MATLGTGIGSARSSSTATSCRTPSSGHLEIDGNDAETRAADSVRDARRPRLGAVGGAAAALLHGASRTCFWPDLIVVGGGVSKKADKFLPLLDLRTPIVPARAAQRRRHRRRARCSRTKREAALSPR